MYQRNRGPKVLPKINRNLDPRIFGQGLAFVCLIVIVQLPIAWKPVLAQSEQISVEQGLSQSTVHCILQDDVGLMWFGTEDGLNRYDGYTFAVYKHDPEDPDSISDNWIWTLYVDQEGSLWIGTREGGLARFDAENQIFIHYQHDPQNPHSLSGNEVRSIYQDKDGMLWVGTSKGLDRLVLPQGHRDDVRDIEGLDPAQETFVHYRHDPDDPLSLSSNAILVVYEDREGELWIGTDGGGLNRWDRTTESFIRYANDPTNPQSLSHDTVQAIYQDQEGELWIGTDGGLDRFDRENGRFIRYQGESGSDLDPVRAMRQAQDGTLWIGTWGSGPSRFDQESQQFVSYVSAPDNVQGTGQGLDYDRLWDIYQDRSGALWLGTDSYGLVKLDVASRAFAHHQNDPDHTNSLGNNSVRGIYQDRSGALWIGTDGGLDSFDQDRGQWIHYRNDPDNPHSLGDNSVWGILQDREGMLWIGTQNGLDRLDPKTGQFTHFRSDPDDPQTLSHDWVLPIYQDPEGILWIGTFAGGLNRFDPETQTFTRYQTDPNDPHSLGAEGVMSIYQDREGTLWIGTIGGGLDRLDRDRGIFVHYPNDPNDPGSLSHNMVASIYQDREGTLWVGTLGGLNRFDSSSETFHHYREKDGLANDVVYGIVEDKAGLLWFSTNNGLSRFEPQTETFRNFDTHDGLQSSEFNSLAYHRADSGQVFLGGINGFNAFYPEDLRDNPYVPPIVLTGLTQGHKEADTGTAVYDLAEITFRWPNNFFEFEFAALSYIHPEENQYAYKLAGFEEGWNQIGTRRFGRYTNLPGGTYTLHLKGSNHDGIWNEMGASIQVTVVPPFWATWWFRGTLLLILVGGAIGGYRLRVRGLEARSRELQVQVEQRTAELEKTNLSLEQEITERKRAEVALARQAAETAVGKERNRMARDLHDSVTQSLHSSTLLAEAGRRLASSGDLERATGYLTRLGEISQQALKEMRLLVYELRPLALKESGLAGALQRRLDAVERRAGMEARLIVEGEANLPATVEEELYRIAQEALNNALKHGEPTSVVVTLRFEGAPPDQRVELEIVDDGQGFVPQVASDRGGMGLVSMGERAKKIGGRLTVHSALGEGTRVAVVVGEEKFS